MEIESRVPVPGERVEDSHPNIDDIDVDEILNRPRRRRGLFRRQKACLNKGEAFLDAPEFTRRLNAFEEAKAGSTVVFECQWQAFPRPTIKWYKDDEEVIENNRFRKEEGESGSTKLYIDNCRKKDEGAYKCKAENSEGVASTTGYLSVAGDIKEKKLSSQPRKNCQHAVSNPPRLIAITEQKSLELREEEEFNMMPPSPINDDIEHLLKEKLVHKKTSSPPTTPDTEDAKKVVESDEDDSGSDTSCDSQDFDRVPTYDPEDDERELTPERPSEGHFQSGQPEGQSEAGKPAGQSKRSEVKGQKENGPGVQGSQLYMLIKPDGRFEQIPKPSPEKKLLESSEETILPIKLCPNYISYESAPTVQKRSSCYRPITITPEKSLVSAPPRNLENTRPKTAEESAPEITSDFPWLVFLALSSCGTFVASATELSPFWYVVALAILSLLSFRFLVTTKPSCT